MFRRFTRGFLVTAVGIGLALAPASQSEAVNWTFTQIGGFEQEGASTGIIDGGGPASFFGALEFHNPVSTIGGLTQYQNIGWGCNADGTANSTGGNCAGGVNTPTAANTTATTATDPTTIGDGRSALQLNTFNGGIADDGVFVAISQLIHFNNVIDNDSRTLGEVNITAALDLAPAVTGPFPNENTIRIGFLETFNDTITNICDETSNPLGSTCDDRFNVITVGGFDPVAFSFNGQQFTMEFTIGPPADCVAGAIVDGVTLFNCPGGDPAVDFGINFTTFEVYARENQDSQLFVFARILPVEVPLPATAVLMGLGLLSMGLIRRRIGK